jgi:hypothetical protein
MTLSGRIISLFLAAMLLTGCAKTLRSSEDASSFIRDIVQGKSVSDWRLDRDAVGAAMSAWINRTYTSDLSRRLREHGQDWACDTAKAAHSARKIYNGLYSEINANDRSTIIRQATGHAATESEVTSLIGDVLRSAPLEYSEIISKLCELEG